MLSWLFNLAMGGGDVELSIGDTDVDKLKITRVNVLGIKSKTLKLSIISATAKLTIKSVS